MAWAGGECLAYQEVIPRARFGQLLDLEDVSSLKELQRGKKKRNPPLRNPTGGPLQKSLPALLHSYSSGNWQWKSSLGIPQWEAY